jgi:formylglycine-generating enzyme required for sulfatase activity
MNFTTKIIKYPSLLQDASIQLNEASVDVCTINLLDQFDLEFIKIPSGNFLMGSTEADTGPDAMPQHEVSVKSFLMSQACVTQDLYEAVVGKNPSFFKIPSLPIECINWFEAKNFCDLLTSSTPYQFRLPSESEWEYAARAGTTSTFYCGETITNKIGNYMAEVPWKNGPSGDYVCKTLPPNSYPVNPWGLSDMSGNVFDWCQDVYCTYEHSPCDGSANERLDGPEERLLRGGSWYHSPIACAVTTRLKIDPLYKGPDIGMRLVVEEQ